MRIRDRPSVTRALPMAMPHWSGGENSSSPVGIFTITVSTAALWQESGSNATGAHLHSYTANSQLSFTCTWYRLINFSICIWQVHHVGTHPETSKHQKSDCLRDECKHNCFTAILEVSMQTRSPYTARVL